MKRFELFLCCLSEFLPLPVLFSAYSSLPVLFSANSSLLFFSCYIPVLLLLRLLLYPFVLLLLFLPVLLLLYLHYCCSSTILPLLFSTIAIAVSTQLLPLLFPHCSPTVPAPPLFLKVPIQLQLLLCCILPYFLKLFHHYCK